MKSIYKMLCQWGSRQVSVLVGAIAFYTCLPMPPNWTPTFQGIARWAAVIGVLIGAVLGLIDNGLTQLRMPMLVRSAVVVVVWLAITGGLHLDGAMDTADGLAVFDPQRRLEVMADSRAGAFGVMAAAVILLLKITALSSMESQRWLMLMAAAGWGRWGQLVAIARYPYLRPNGKGALHKTAIHSLWDAFPSFLLLLGIGGLSLCLDPEHWGRAIALTGGGMAIALFTGIWFNLKLGGHTGDTYGAVVEWTEAILLCVLTAV